MTQQTEMITCTAKGCAEPARDDGWCLEHGNEVGSFAELFLADDSVFERWRLGVQFGLTHDQIVQLIIVD